MEDNQSIEVKELSSVALSAISSPYAISWSEDNKVSILSTSVLHIIELCPSPSISVPSISMKRTMIKPAGDLPTTETGVDTDALIWKLDQEEVYQMVLDCRLAPSLSSTKPMDIHMKQAQWSSNGMLQEHRCLIACLTSHGCVKVYAPHLREWIVVVNVSSCWVECCKKLWPEENVDTGKQPSVQEVFNILKQRTAQLKTTALVWSKMMTVPKKFSFLVLAQHSGQIVIWRMYAVNLSILDESSLSMALIHDTGLQHITALHWLRWDEHIVTLMIGNTDGCVKMMMLSTQNEEISCVGVVDVWSEADRMQVLRINSLPYVSGDKYRVIAFAKSSYVIAFLINHKEVLASCHQLVGNLNVSGLEVIDKETFLVCTHTGCISKLHVTITEPAGLSLEVQELPTNISWKNLACYGFTSSRNNTLWAMATSICKLYDHLVIRKPAQVIFFYLQGMMNPLQKLLYNTTDRLTNNWEYLEHLRIQCMKKSLELNHSYLENFEELEKLSSFKLRLELWLARITLTQVSAVNNIAKQEQMVKYIHYLEQLLFCRYACDSVDKLTSSPSTMNEQELVVLGLLRAWIRACLASKELTWSVLEAVAEAKLHVPEVPSVPSRETCSLCQNEVTMTNNWRYAVCQIGHRIPRCSKTLRQCVKLPFQQCQICLAVALPGLINDCFCVFCDSSLILDDKIKLKSNPESQENQPPQLELPTKLQPESTEQEAQGNT